MSAKANDVQKQLQILRLKYLNDLPEKLSLMKAQWEGYKKNSQAESALQDLSRVSHGLAGSGATFGCPEISTLARQLFNVCKRIAENANERLSASEMEVELLFKKLEESTDRYIKRGQDQLQVFESIDIAGKVEKESHLVFIVEDDDIFAQAIASSLRATGYEVRIFNDAESVELAVNEQRPDVMLMDMMLDRNELSGAVLAKEFSQKKDIPLIFLSVRDDFTTRLEAVRSGAIHYFTKPVDISRLIDCLDKVTRKKLENKYRVLLVDDDVALTGLYALDLNSNGFDVRVLNSPTDTIAQIEILKPDLIVLDIDMPEINGLELGAVIRQYDEFNHIPIVFLTADTRLETRLETMYLGADDFLSKPISSELLAYALKARMTRANALEKGRKDLQDTLKDLEFLRKALDNHAIVSVADIEGNILYANSKFSEISGYSNRELIGKNHRILKSDRHGRDFYDDMWKTISSGKIWSGVITNRRKNGTHYIVFSTIVPKLDDAGLPQQYVSIRTDITALKNLEQDYRVEAERLTLALQATDSAIWEWNITTGEAFYSDNWHNLLGFEDSKGDISWPELIHPEDFQAAFASLLDHADGKSAQYISEHRVKNKFGEWEWVRDVGATVEKDSQDKPVRIVGTTQLISKRIELEQQKQAMQEQLIQASKMEAVGHLTAGIAHDFNNLLGGILGYAELSLERAQKEVISEKLKNYLSEILTAGGRAKELISQMLTFSRSAHDTSDDVPPVTLLQPVIKEVVQLVRSSIPSSIEINYFIEDSTLKAAVQPVHLHQILLNLCINARDAIQNYGKIDVNLSRAFYSTICDSCHTGFNGEYAVLSVCDNGEGIDEQNLNKVFDPFYTTKEVGKGTGMGLSVVHGVVHALGGHVQITSGKGKGTEIRVLLPLAEMEPSQATEVVLHSSEEKLLSGLTVMVVDDEISMSTMLTELLSVYGANTVCFNDPQQALDYFCQHKHEVDLVLTDETMPGLTGFHMASQMLSEKPGLPVILCTGYSETINEEKALQAGIASFMHKPLDMKQLVRQVNQYARSGNIEGRYAG